MFNPFKKKEDGFKLDDYSLPSFEESSNNGNNGMNNNINNSVNNNFSANSLDNSLSNQGNMGDSPFPQESTLSSMTNQQQQQQQQTMPIGSSDIRQSTPFPTDMNQSVLNTQNPQTNNEMGNINQDINTAKIDAMESKVALIDAKLSSIEQKLEFLNQMLLCEVSDETKRKLNMQSMMNNVRNQ